MMTSKKLGARTLLGAPGLTTRNKKLLGAPGHTTRSKSKVHHPTCGRVLDAHHLPVQSTKETTPILQTSQRSSYRPQRTLGVALRKRQVWGTVLPLKNVTKEKVMDVVVRQSISLGAFVFLSLVSQYDNAIDVVGHSTILQNCFGNSENKKSEDQSSGAT